VWAVAAATVALAGGDAALAGPASVVGAGRRVLGSIRTTGRVEGSVDGRRWLALYPNAAVLDGMQIRVPGEGSATLALVGGDEVVFASRSAGDVANAVGTRVRLDRGRLALRLRPASTLVAEAGRGIVRAVPGKAEAAAGVLRHERATARTTLETTQGRLELRALGTDTGTVVEQGHQAWVGPSGPASGATLPSAEGDPRAAGGVLGVAGLSPVAGAAVAGVAAAGVGAGVGGAAASGAFSGDESSSPDAAAAGGREGSPFRPVRR